MTGPDGPPTMRPQLLRRGFSDAPDASRDAEASVASLPSVAPAGASVAPLNVGDRSGVALRAAAGAAAGVARGLWLDPGRLLHVLYHGRPGSMSEHMAYLKSAAWVPEEMTGRPRAFLVAAGVAYHVIVAWPLKLAAKAIDSAADRPLRLAGLALLVIALTVLLSHL